MKIVVQQHRKIHSKHEMRIPSLISYECILLLHMQKKKMQPIQAKYGAQQFNLSLFYFYSLKTQNRSKYAARTGNGNDAQSQKKKKKVF